MLVTCGPFFPTHQGYMGPAWARLRCTLSWLTWPSMLQWKSVEICGLVYVMFCIVLPFQHSCRPPKNKKDISRACRCLLFTLWCSNVALESPSRRSPLNKYWHMNQNGLPTARLTKCEALLLHFHRDPRQCHQAIRESLLKSSLSRHLQVPCDPQGERGPSTNHPAGGE